MLRMSLADRARASPRMRKLLTYANTNTVFVSVETEKLKLNITE